MDNEFDGLAYHKERLRLLVWSGFFNAQDFEIEARDMRYDPDAAPHVDELRRYTLEQMAAKKEAEKSWPAVTDWDRLDGVFTALTQAKILTLHNAGYTQNDAHSDAWELVNTLPGDWRGFVFYHGQDVERAIEGLPLFLGFDAISRDPEAKTAVGMEFTGALRAAGFTIDWDGDPEKRPAITNLDWKKRTVWETR